VLKTLLAALKIGFMLWLPMPCIGQGKIYLVRARLEMRVEASYPAWRKHWEIITPEVAIDFACSGNGDQRGDCVKAHVWEVLDRAWYPPSHSGYSWIAPAREFIFG